MLSVERRAILINISFVLSKLAAYFIVLDNYARCLMNHLLKKRFWGFLIIIIKKQFRSGEVNYSYTPSNQFELISVFYKSTNKYSLNIQLSCTQLHYSEDKGWQSSQILPRTTARKRSVNYVARQNL